MKTDSIWFLKDHRYPALNRSPRLRIHYFSGDVPCYFIKEQSVINHCYTEIDLKIFRQYLAPALGITHRFVGTEPFCTVTAQYNLDMRFWLETPTLPPHPLRWWK